MAPVAYRGVAVQVGGQQQGALSCWVDKEPPPPPPPPAPLRTSRLQVLSRVYTPT